MEERALGVPKNLPYFCMTFYSCVHDRYICVTEDGKYFPRNFEKDEILGIWTLISHLYKNRRGISKKFQSI
ncbi:hypothetical protein NPIL_393891 [Nephila pilipes]|uniref:Uncharacterized protein n=1 Tax=Nephila pilipes TaxID=299642 RepID=A0A8X6QFY9_NEPPI|nr:hypothetical protein NPIL_393891 [Nephila pilipes]